MDPAEKKKIIGNLITYSVLVCILGWVGVVIDKMTPSQSGQGPGMLLWILAPILVSSYLRRFKGDGWSDFGIKLILKGNRISNLTSMFFYPFVVLITIQIGKASGAIETISTVSTKENLLIATFTALLVPQLIQNILEESGFRGYMSPKLEKLKIHPLYAYLITGFVWGVWHLPYFRVITSYTFEPLITLIPRFLIGTMVVSILYGEIRRRTQSVWPSIIMQTMGGTLIATIFTGGLVRVQSTSQLWFNPTIEGGVMIVITGLTGLLFLRSTLKRTHPRTTDN